MTETIKLKLYKLVVIGILAFGLLFIYSKINSAFSQSPTPSTSPAAASELKYPIEELGGCKSEGSCMDYCNDPINYNSCTDFAKKNGFYQDDVTIYAADDFWEDVKNELGCDSSESCSTFCSQPGNYDSCSAFAKRNSIPGGYTEEIDPGSEIIQEAEDFLGCDSPESCQSYCENSDNAGKCSDFADRVGIIGGNETSGPGGCNSAESCSAYCSDPNNFSQCKSFAGGNFSGPGGCNSPESCRSFCEQNPNDCRSYAPGTSGAYVPMVCSEGAYHGPGGMCTAVENTREASECVGRGFWNGDSCLVDNSIPEGIDSDVPNANFEQREDMGGCTTPGSCYDFCVDNSDSPACSGFDPNTPRPSDEYNPYIYYTPGTEVRHAPVEEMGGCTSPAECYDYCSSNPGQCEGFSSRSPRPPEVYIPGTYYTPPSDIVYATPPTTSFYTTPIYYTPPEGSNYTTPQYYTPGTYYTPSYQTPPSGSNYATPTYYSPWSRYPTPTGEYPTPNYSTPTYYTPPIGSNYTTPYYYTPPPYTTPYYYTPGEGSRYTTPSYSTPPPYSTPQYYTPINVGTYSTPVYYTPPTYSTPVYYTPPPGSNYASPSYYTPPVAYTTPRYYTPGTYPTPVQYSTPPPYTSPQYYTPPPGSNYTSPTYYTPTSYSTPTYYTPTSYSTPAYYTPYSSPSYYTPPEGSTYVSPSYYTPYNTPSGTTTSYSSPSYVYPSPSGTGTNYYTPNSSYTYPSPTDGYVSPSYVSPYVSPSGSYSYPTPSSGYSYPTPSSYGTPTYTTPTYGTPEYGTPTYGTPSYDTPSYSYPTPVQGTTSKQNLLQRIWTGITNLIKR